MFERFACVAILLVTSPALGQAVAVQQPVFETFSGGTTVSVPDHGAAFVGGVGRASAARSSFGPLRSRGATTRGTAGASVSAGVFIHDFQTMDAAVLDAASGSTARPVFTKGRYDDPTSFAMSRRLGGSRRAALTAEADRNPSAIPSRPLGGLTPPARQVSWDTDRLLKLGAEAERRGQPGVAAIHYRMAAKDGSAEAQRRLASLAQAGEKAVTTSQP